MAQQQTKSAKVAWEAAAAITEAFVEAAIEKGATEAGRILSEPLRPSFQAYDDCGARALRVQI